MNYQKKREKFKVRNNMLIMDVNNLFYFYSTDNLRYLRKNLITYSEHRAVIADNVQRLHSKLLHINYL
jgi:hypothetical protein